MKCGAEDGGDEAEKSGERGERKRDKNSVKVLAGFLFLLNFIYLFFICGFVGVRR